MPSRDGRIDTKRGAPVWSLLSSCVVLVLAAILACCGKREISGSPGGADAQDDPGIDVAEAVDPDLPDTSSEPDPSDPDEIDCSLAPDLETSHWIVKIGGSEDELPYDLAVKPDGSIVVAGKHGSPEIRSFMLSVDGTGNVIDAKTIEGIGTYLRVVALDDCGLLLAGTTTASGAGRKDVWLARLDASGAILWQRTIGHGGDEDWPVVIPTADGGYLMTATIFSSISSDMGLWLVKLGPDASIEWQERFGVIFENYTTPPAEGPDGTLYALWPDQWGTGIVSLDPGGGIRWQKVFEDDMNAHLWNIVVDGTEIVCSGLVYDWYHAVIVKMDAASGDILWSKMYNSEEGSGLAWTIIRRGDGGFYVNGHYYGTHASGPWLASIDPDGGIAWQVTIDGTLSPTEHIARHVDGLLVLGYGFTTSYDVWMARLGLDGTFSGECPLVGPATVSPTDIAATLHDTDYVPRTTYGVVQEADPVVLTDMDVTEEFLCP